MCASSKIIKLKFLSSTPPQRSEFYCTVFSRKRQDFLLTWLFGFKVIEVISFKHEPSLLEHLRVLRFLIQSALTLIHILKNAAHKLKDTLTIVQNLLRQLRHWVSIRHCHYDLASLDQVTLNLAHRHIDESKLFAVAFQKSQRVITWLQQRECKQTLHWLIQIQQVQVLFVGGSLRDCRSGWWSRPAWDRLF